jgi:hypothetical protein
MDSFMDKIYQKYTILCNELFVLPSFLIYSEFISLLLFVLTNIRTKL